MRENIKLTDIFKRYFIKSLGSQDYQNMYKLLSELENAASTSLKYPPFESEDKRVKDFVEQFYDFKRVLQTRYKRGVENANSLEEQIRPTKDRIMHKLMNKHIIKTYSNCVKFEEMMDLRFCICMAIIDKDIQQNKEDKSDIEL